MSDMDSQFLPSSSSPIKLPYQVIFCSSHDDRYPPSSLTSSPNSSSSASLHGWQSARHCQYPQTLILSFPTLCDLRKVQLLSHQSKIPKSVELYAGNAKAGRKKGGGAAEDVDWIRLGYFTLDSNEKSDYKARELKSVPINAQASQLKLVIKGAHNNPLNIHHQVSIVALHILGVPLSPLPLPPPPPSSSLSSLSPPPNLPPELDITTTQYILHLCQLKAQAIDAEDYDTAKVMKERMERLMAEVGRLVECEKRKREAIEREDYDEAKQCKLEVEKIRERALKGAGAAGREERKDRGDTTRRKEREPAAALPESSPSSLPPARAVISDDDRPIKPAKSALPPPSHDDIPVGGKRSTQPPLAADDDSFPVTHASPDDRPLRPPPVASSAYNEDRPIKSKHREEPQTVSSPRRDDDRALPPAHSSYEFDDSALPPSDSSSSLPAPEPIPPSLSKEAEPLIALFGSVLTSQLLSRHWQLRTEALGTIQTLVADEASPVREGGGWAREVGRVLVRVLGDKVAQVFVAGARLLEVAMKEGKKGPKEEVKGLVEGVAKVMCDRLSASNARERDQAMQVLLYLALHKSSPPSIVPSALLAPLKKKEADHPTPLRARLLLLHSLLLRFGLAEAAGLTLPPLMRFTVPLLSHRDAGVRDAAFNIIASVCSEGMRGKVDTYLKDLPAGVMAGLEGRIEDVQSGIVSFPRVEAPAMAYVERVVKPDAAVGTAVVSPRRHHERKEEPLSARREKSDKKEPTTKKQTRHSEPPLSIIPNGHEEVKKTAKARVSKEPPPEDQPIPKPSAKGKDTKNGKSPAPPSNYTDEEVEEVYTDDDHDGDHLALPNQGSPSQYQLTHAAPASPSAPASPPLSPLPTQCQFCGLEDPSFTEEALDLHYWQACPMLLSCPRCEQVVEIPTFGEHLVGECEAEGVWKACRRCGWVVEEGGLEEHERDCGGVMEGNVICQLCCKEIEGSEEGWRRHLLEEGCVGNVRTNGQESVESIDTNEQAE